jgi:flagellar hook-associated protein 1 FlgK
MSGFSSLNTAVSGLAAAQRAMDVTGQNVVNANTPGYSRQRVELKEVGAQSGASRFSGPGSPTGGVEVSTVTRIRGVFVEAAAAAAIGRHSAITTQTGSLSAVQTAFAEPGATGLQAAMDAFYASWHELAANPTNPAAAAVIVQKGKAVADQFRSLDTAIKGQWNFAYDGLKDVVSQVNQAARDLADVNGRIATANAAGLPVNELADQRDLLTRALATHIGGAATIGADGQASVSVSGVALVSGTVTQKFELSGGTIIGDVTATPPNPPVVTWNGVVVPVAAGAAAGQLAVLGSDLPAALTDLDTVAASLASIVNGLHSGGYAANSATPTGDFFTGTTAGTLSVLVVNPADVAVTTLPNKIDGSLAQAVADLADEQRQATALGGPGPSAQWRTMTTALGVKVQSLQNAATVQESVVAAAEAAVQTDAGVNLDEEMTNLLQFQRSYQAAARVVSTIDEILDTLINRTGR